MAVPCPVLRAKSLQRCSPARHCNPDFTMVTDGNWRSMSLALVSVVPNAFPLIATAATMVVLKMPLQYASVLAFTISLGIAVDDTVHFIARLRHEKASGHDDTALERTFRSMAPVLIITTAFFLNFVLGVLGVPQALTQAVTAFGTSAIVFIWLLPALARFLLRPDKMVAKARASK